MLIRVSYPEHRICRWKCAELGQRERRIGCQHCRDGRAAHGLAEAGVLGREGVPDLRRLPESSRFLWCAIRCSTKRPGRKFFLRLRDFSSILGGASGGKWRTTLPSSLAGSGNDVNWGCQRGMGKHCEDGNQVDVKATKNKPSAI